MTPNDILRSLRYALNITDAALARMAALADGELAREDVASMLKREDEEGYLPCSPAVLLTVLDGLIVQRRGRQESAPAVEEAPLFSYNLVLRKLRIAFELREEELQAILTLADFQVSRPELSALFRRPEHKNYRPCREQFLRNFLKGLALFLRQRKA